MAHSQAVVPEVGLFTCFSGSSNSGSLAGMAALEVVRRLGAETVGICSLPAVLNRVPRQSALIGNIPKIVVVDGCHNACARQLLAGVGIRPARYVNLEADLGIAKTGPFTSLEFTDREIREVADALVVLIQADAEAAHHSTSEGIHKDEPGA